MLFLLTNIGSFILIGLLACLGLVLQRKVNKRIFSTYNLTISAMFCALSVVLTNVVGYSFIFGMQFMLGNFLIFLTGMIFGPLIGAICGIITDTVGVFINSGGVYHAGFMLIKVILGFAGGFVFMFKTNQYWKLKAIAFFSGAFIISAILSPIFLFTLYGTSYTMVKFITKLIKLPVELFVYNFFIYITFKISYLFLEINQKQRHQFWFLKNGSLKIRRKKSLREKYKVDLYGKRFQTKKETTIYYQEINYNKNR